MKVFTLAPYCMAVASSEPDISAPPSPRNRITCRLRVAQRRRHRRRHADAHGAADAADHGVLARERKMPMQPAGEIAGVRDEDRVLLDRLGERGNDRPHVQQPVGRRRPDHALGDRLAQRLHPLRRAWSMPRRGAPPAPPETRSDRRSAHALPHSCGRSGARRHARGSAAGADAATAAAYSPAWSPRRDACRRRGSDRRPGSDRWSPSAS